MRPPACSRRRALRSTGSSLLLPSSVLLMLLLQQPLPSAGAFMNIFNGNILQNTDPCYDERGAPRRCIPDFVNAAFGQVVKVSRPAASWASPLSVKCVERGSDTAAGRTGARRALHTYRHLLRIPLRSERCARRRFGR